MKTEEKKGNIMTAEGSTVSHLEGRDEPVVMIAVDEICLNPVQPRKKFEQEKIRELAESIEKYGLLQPVIVTRKEGLYHLVVGERRLRAVRNLGHGRIPAIVREYAWEEMLKVALVENIQREDLNPLEEARSYNLLIRDYHMTQEQVAEAIGHSRSYVANMVRLLNLPREIMEDLETGELSPGHARALLSLEDGKKILQAAARIRRNQLSVRQTEEMVRRIKKESPNTGRKMQTMPREFVQAGERLSKVLSAPVGIRQMGSRGKIEITFGSREELDRIVALLEGPDPLI